MRQIVQALVHLQEQELVLAESRILHEAGAAEVLGELEGRVAELRASIEPGYLRKFDSLRRNGAGVVSAAQGVCHGCHLNVPVGDLNRMRRGQMPWVCPNCARFLIVS